MLIHLHVPWQEPRAPVVSIDAVVRSLLSPPQLDMPFLPVSSCCLEGFVLPGEPKGVIEPATATQTIARYHATPADGLPPANRAVILAYDGLGFSSVSCSPVQAYDSPTPASSLTTLPIALESMCSFQTIFVSAEADEADCSQPSSRQAHGAVDGVLPRRTR